MDCGESETFLLDFDHVRGKKRAEISRLVHQGSSRAVLDLEMSKCELVCANCHRRRTGRRQRSWRAIAAAGGDPATNLRPNQTRNLRLVREVLEASGCIDCGELDLLVLEFDHIGPKGFNVTRGIWLEYSLERMTTEIAQCEVTCTNCHRRRTRDRARSRETSA
jgi:L-lysine 2,3-aminomutase